MTKPKRKRPRWPWARPVFDALRTLWQALKKFDSDNGFFLAGGITFSVLVNLIPFIILLLAVLGGILHDDADVMRQIRRYLAEVAPSLDDKIMATLMDVIQNRQFVGVVGLVGLLWSSIWVFTSLRVALDIVVCGRKTRGFFRGLALDTAMVVLVGGLLVASMVLNPIVMYLQSYQGPMMVRIGPTIEWVLGYLLPFALSFFMFVAIYRFLPTVRLAWKSVAIAALFSGLLWEVAKHLFAWYAVSMGSYSVFYGSLSAVAVGVFWVYYSAAILLVGGELAYALDASSVIPSAKRSK